MLNNQNFGKIIKNKIGIININSQGDFKFFNQNELQSKKSNIAA